MAFDPVLAERVRTLLCAFSQAEEKKMFGDICWMVDGQMCVGVVKDELMVRMDPSAVSQALTQPGVRMMIFTGRSMKGLLFISPEGLISDVSLRRWITLALAFNPHAIWRAPKLKKH